MSHFQFGSYFFPVDQTIIQHLGKGKFQVRPAGAARPFHFQFAPEHATPILVYLKNRLCQCDDQEWEETWDEVKTEPVPVDRIAIGMKVCLYWEADNKWYRGEVTNLTELHGATVLVPKDSTSNFVFGNIPTTKLIPCLKHPPSFLECCDKNVLWENFKGNITAVSRPSEQMMSHIVAILP